MKHKLQKVDTDQLQEQKKKKKINPKIIWNFIKKKSNKNINTPINHLSQGNTNAIR